MFDCDVAYSFRGELRNLFRRLVVETDFAALNQQHYSRRASHDFCERGRIENRVPSYRLLGGSERAFPKRPVIAVTVVFDPKHTTGTVLFRNGLIDDGIHLGKFVHPEITNRVNVGLGRYEWTGRDRSQNKDRPPQTGGAESSRSHHSFARRINERMEFGNAPF